jgi:hypothetical protein
MAGEHVVCKQIERIAKLEQKQIDTTEEVKDIKDTLKWNNRWLIGIMATSILTLIGIIYSNLKH